MWILDKNETAVYAVERCTEFYINDFCSIEVCLGKSLKKNSHRRVLGKYENPLEARWAFQQLTEWLEHPEDKKVFRMPYEMPRENLTC